jgi:penicillin amidase
LEINRLPPVWYEAVLRWRTPQGPRYAMGATFPGLLGVAVGRTPDLAWGVTYAFMDSFDSWIEDCREGKYRRGEEWLPFVSRKEVVRRKKHPPLELTFYENQHGVLDGNPNEAGLYLATRWSAREGAGAEALDGSCAILTARTVEAGQAALGRVSNSSWNWVLADRTGSIGYQMSGKSPIRPPGVSGLVPLPGWDPANDWQGFHPPEALPRALNPAKGFIVTANQDLNHLGQAFPINLCMASYRADRIIQRLARNGSGAVDLPRWDGKASNMSSSGGDSPLTLEDMRRLQMDLYSLQAEQFMAVFKPMLGEFAAAHGEAVNCLREWDHYYSSDSKAAFLFEEFYRALIREVFGECEGSFGRPVLERILHETCLFFDFYGNFDRVLLSEKSTWFGKRSRTELYRAALAKALATPPQPYGQTRKLRMRHLLFGGKLPLFLGFDRMLEMPGNRATVHQGQIFRGGGRELSFAPSLRFLTDLAADEVQTTLAGGVSDRPFSKWYANGLADWVGGLYKTLSSKSADLEP